MRGVIGRLRRAGAPPCKGFRNARSDAAGRGGRPLAGIPAEPASGPGSRGRSRPPASAPEPLSRRRPDRLRAPPSPDGPARSTAARMPGLHHPASPAAGPLAGLRRAARRGRALERRPRPAASARPRRALRALAAAALLALPLLAALAPAARAQDTLVSNIAEEAGSSGFAENATAFTTGSNAYGGYTLSAVDIPLAQVSGRSTVVTIRAGAGTNPGILVATLANPSSLTNGVNTFTAPANTTLAASTTYFLVVNDGRRTSVNSNVGVSLATSNAQTGAAGWSIADSSRYRTSSGNSWLSSSASIVFALKGAPNGPAAPAGLTATPGPGSGQVTLRWTASDDSRITSYQYDSWRGTPGAWGGWRNFNPGAGGAASSARISGLINGTQYGFRVRARAGALRGAASDAATATPAANLPPFKPTGLTATAGNGQVTLRFDNPRDSRITSYRYRFRTSGGSWIPWNTRASTGNATELTIFSLTNGTTYDFQIQAVAGSVRGPASDTVSATPTAPPAKPTGLAAEALDRRVELSWDDPSNSAITKYQYRRGTGDPVTWGEWTDSSNSRADTTSIILSGGLANGTEYSFQIRAVAGTLTGAASDTVTATPMAPSAQFRTASTQVTEQDILGSIFLDIAPAPSAPITLAYTVAGTATRGSDGDFTLPASDSVAVPAGRGAVFIQIGLTEDALREPDETVILTLDDGAGYDLGARTTHTLTIENDDPPLAPAGFAAAAGDGQVVLSWTDPSDAAISGYQFRQRTPPDTGSWGSWTAIASSTAATTTHTVTGLTNGTAYGFQVRALDGTLEGAASSEATATPAAATAGVTTATTDGEATEGSTTDTATFTVVLNTPPSQTVAVAVTAPDGLELSTGGTFGRSQQVAFTNSFWSTPQTVTVRATDDSTDSPLGRELSVTYTTSSQDSNYRTFSGTAATVTVADNDPTAVTLAGAAGDVAEGATKTFTVTLGRGLVNGEVLPVPLTFGGEATRGTDYTTACPTTLPTGVACANLDSGNAMVTFTGPSTGTTATTVTLTLTAATDGTTESGGETVVIGLGTLNANSGTGLGGGASGADSLADFRITDAAAAPAAPTGFTAAAGPGGGQITLSWTPPSGTVTGYQYRVRRPGGGWFGWANMAGGANITTFTSDFTEVLDFQMRARNGSLFGAPSAIVRATPVAAPAAPTGFAAAAGPGGGQVTLSWSDPSNSDIAKYQFRRKLSSAGAWGSWTDFAGGTTAASTGGTVAGLTNGAAYDFQVRATAAPGGTVLGAASAAATATPRAPALVLDPASLTVAEGASGAYTVALATRPTATVTVTVAGASGEVTFDTDSATPGNQSTLTFSTTTWSAPRTVAVSAGEDGDTANDSATLTHSASGGGYGSVTGSVAVTVADNDAPGLVLNPTSLTVAEGGSATYTVALATEPTGNVTVTVGGASGEVTFDTDSDAGGNQSMLTFNASNWSTAKTVTVSAGEDGDTANDSATLTHSASGGGYGSVTGNVVVMVTDNDTPGLVLDPTSLTVAEGGSGTYTVALATQPTGTVTVTVGGASGEVTVDTNPGTSGDQDTLTFNASNWSTAKTVTVTAGEDNDTTNDSATLTHSASGGGYGSVTGSVAVTVDDNDAPAAAAPAAPTGLAAAAGDGRVVLSWNAPASDEITKWQYQLLESTRWIDIPESDATTRSHTVTGLVNGLTYNIRVRAVAGDVNGRPSAPVGARPLFGVAVLSPASLTVAEGGTASYRVRLSAQPNTNVIVGISSSNSDITVSPAGLDFTTGNWGTPQTVTVSASQDTDAVHDRATLSHSVQGGGYTAGSGPDLNLVVNDDESGAPPPPAVQTNTAPTVATPIPDQDARVGAPFSHTFPADTFNDADGDPLTYSATGLPDWLGFDPGTRTFSGTPEAVGAPEVTVTASDGNGGSVSDTFVITIGAANADPVLTIRGGPAVTEGTAARFTVTADSPPTSNLTVNRTVADAPGADFLAAGVEGRGTWTFTGGQTSQTFTIETEADGVAEPNGPVRVTLAAGTGYTLGGASTAAVTVNDDDGPTPPPQPSPPSGGGGGVVVPPPPDPAIAAAGVTATGATLTVDGVSGVWHYRRTRPEGGECSGPQSGESAALAGLMAATEYAYGLYSDSACSNELASVGFATPAPPPSIAATGVTDTGATLTAANVPGGVWRYRRTLPEGGECGGPQSGESAALAGLVAATGYAYALYADSACANELASVEFTTAPSANAALAGLALATRAGGAAALAPAFSPEADAYSAALPFAADSALLTPRTAHPDATVRVGPAGGPLAAVPAQGDGAGGAAVPLSVGVNEIVVEVTAADGATRRTVTLSITRAAPGPLDATAAASHLFPLFADGGGFRSRLLVADAGGGRARCELALRGAGLDTVRFGAEPMSALAETVDGAGIRFRFRSPGGEVLLDSAGAGERAIGHAKLDCDGPVAAQLLLSLEAGGALSAMAHQSPAERGRAFSLPGLPAPLRLGLAFANDGVRGNLCVVEAAEGRGVVAVPPGETAFRLLDEIVPSAGGDGGTGPVAVRCERPAALLAVPLAGGAFTTLAPAVLDADGAADGSAGPRSPLPLVLDGGGFRSRLSAVNLAAGANRCELRLSAAGGLSGANFGAAADGPEGMDGFALALAGRGAQESLDSRGGEAFAFGHAALECEGPAALWNLIVLEGPDGPAGMMAPGPAQPAREMRFRAPPAPARLGLAIANGGGARTACHVALAAADGRAAPPAGFPLISVPARATAIRFLDGMFALPADFAGGAVTLRCDHAVGAVAVPVAGAAFTAVPPIIPGLETVPGAAVDSGGDTPGGNQ